MRLAISRLPVILEALAMSFTLAACRGVEPSPTPTATPNPLSLSSSAFASSAPIPVRYTCFGQDISPPLAWATPPLGTQSFALVMDDPDAPGGTWDHWVVFNLPPSLMEIPENQPQTDTLPAGGTQGRNSWGESDYGGPCPPSGQTHRYQFQLYALDITLGLPAGANKREVLANIAGHILAESLLTSTYQH